MVWVRLGLVCSSVIEASAVTFYICSVEAKVQWGLPSSRWAPVVCHPLQRNFVEARARFGVSSFTAIAWLVSADIFVILPLFIWLVSMPASTPQEP